MAAVKFSKQYVQPNPLEVDYWVDVASNPYGAIIKYYDGEDWTQLNGSGGSVSDFDFYTKKQINQMLSNKADIKDVESKLDDIELAEVIKNIEVADVGDDTLQLVIFKYDNNRVAISLPTATATNPGILSGQDFVNFVKQHQLQFLYTEMYDLFADIRAKFQPNLKAGHGIAIDRTTNVIRTIKDINITWEDIPDESREDIISDAKEEIQTEVKEALDAVDDAMQKITTATTNAITATNRANTSATAAEAAKFTFDSYVEDLSDYEERINESFNSFKKVTNESIDDINDVALFSADKADNAVTTANAAMEAIATLEGLANADTSIITAATVVAKVEQNTIAIQTMLAKEVLLTKEEFDAIEVKDPTVKYFIYEE